MADIGLERIHPGASVDWADGHLGRVERVDPDTIEVVVEDTGRTLVVPADLIRTVGADGSVRLSIARADVERLSLPGADPGTRSTTEEGDTLQLREEELVAHTELEEAGRIRFRKEVEDVPRRLEVDAYHEEVTIEHMPMGRVVKEQAAAREEDGVYIVPIYEEQLVVVKRLVLTEEIHIRREGATERRLFEDTVRRERLVVEDPDQTGRVREHYPTARPSGERVAGDTIPEEEGAAGHEGGFLEKLGRKVLE